MLDVLLPRTDAGVVVQVVAVGVVSLVALAATWRRPHWRIAVLGAGVLVLSLMAVRALH